MKRIGLGLVHEQGWSWKEIFKSQKRSQWVWIATVCIAFVFTWFILIGVWRGFINSRGWQRKLAIGFTVVPLWLYVAVNYFITPIFVKWPPFGF